MTSPFGKMLLIANPTAGRGKDPILPALVAALKERGLDHEVAETKGPGHAIALARDAVTTRDLRMLVAVGGDGTIHEVVNGLIDPATGPRREDAVLGIVPGGSGSDFCRTFGLPRDPVRLAKHLDGDALFPVDAGRMTYIGRDGIETSRVFANIAEIGFGADVTDRANGMPRQFGGARYQISTLFSLRRLRPTQATVSVDHTEVSEPMTWIIVANGQFFGGNTKIAPRALPDDQSLNVQIWRGGRKELLPSLLKARTGEHLPSPNIREFQSGKVSVDSAEPMLIEADGEVLGTTPATFDLLPKALNIKV
ncbi:MAG: diacylglycerol kinase (ATP) [Glaciecola sp.]|jgi:diacylglycerol kinase (ATP)